MKKKKKATWELMHEASPSLGPAKTKEEML